MHSRVAILLVSVCIIAICGLLYELLISTLTSYFQGNSVLHFSLVIGFFLSFMGVGSFLSRFIKKDLISWFIGFELLLGVVGGLSTFILYSAFAFTEYYYGIAFFIIGIIGSLIGIEIPLLTRIVRTYDSLREALSNVLSFDYLGALVASLLFPLVLLPTFGTMRTAFFVGLLNVSVAIMNTWLFRTEIPRFRQLMGACIATSFVLIWGFIFSFQLLGFFEPLLYQDEIVYSKQSTYQKIVLTRWNEDYRLFLNGNLQFSSRDEYRYHEALVHIPMAMSQSHEQVLILGGGDGLIAREVLKYPEIDSITLVDLDPEVTEMATQHPMLKRLNMGAMEHPKVKVINEDAYSFVEKSQQVYDVILIDLPDPNSPELGKLYTAEFYGLLSKVLSTGGICATQSTSPYFAPKAFWCIHRTLEEVFPRSYAYSAFVPAFGLWGFNMAQNLPINVQDSSMTESAIKQIQSVLDQRAQELGLRFLQPALIPSLFVFDVDTEEQPVEVNHLEDQGLIQYYEESWSQWQ
ncbi:MAG: polyamine aminopropyltransferase [Bacteroidota bacterium]